MNLELLFNTYGYWIIFIGTVIDHSGIPLFIVFAGVLQSKNDGFLLPAYLACLLALELTDILALLIGKYFKYKVKFETINKNNYSKYYKSYFTGIISKILNTGAEFYNKSKGIVYILNKWLPAVGKYLPVFIGYQEEKIFKQFLILIIGNILYITFFYFIGYFFGLSIQSYSKMFSFVSVIIFLFVYFVSVKLLNNSKKIGD